MVRREKRELRLSVGASRTGNVVPALYQYRAAWSSLMALAAFLTEADTPPSPLSGFLLLLVFSWLALVVVVVLVVAVLFFCLSLHTTRLPDRRLPFFFFCVRVYCVLIFDDS